MLSTWKLKILFVAILTSILSVAKSCRIVESIPERVDCASYANISSESTATGKGLFCRCMLSIYCKKSQTHIYTDFNHFLSDAMCTNPLISVNTNSKLRVLIKLLIKVNKCRMENISAWLNIYKFTI